MWKHSGGVMDEAQSISLSARGRDTFLGFNYRFALSEREKSRGRGSQADAVRDTAAADVLVPADITVLQVLPFSVQALL